MNSLKQTLILISVLFLLVGGFLGYLILDKNKTIKSYEEQLIILQNKEQSIQEELQKSNTQKEKYAEDLKKIGESINTLEQKIEELEKQNQTLSDEKKNLEDKNKQLQKDLQAKLDRKKQEAVANSNSSASSSEKGQSAGNSNSGTQQPSYNGPKTAYLTFDDGPSANTERILATLKQEGVKATFFVNGNSSDFAKGLYKRIVNEGHVLANHTYSHDYSKIYKNTEAFMADVDKLNNLLEGTVGQSPKVLRFPGGSNNTVSHKYGYKGLTSDISKELSRKGYVFFDWNVDSTDASVALQSKSKIVSSVLNGAKNKKNAVILFHDSKPKTTTADALPEVIKGLKEQGFTFEVLTTNTYAPQFINKKY